MADMSKPTTKWMFVRSVSLAVIEDKSGSDCASVKAPTVLDGDVLGARRIAGFHISGTYSFIHSFRTHDTDSFVTKFVCRVSDCA